MLNVTEGFAGTSWLSVKIRATITAQGTQLTLMYWLGGEPEDRKSNYRDHFINHINV